MAERVEDHRRKSEAYTHMKNFRWRQAQLTTVSGSAKGPSVLEHDEDTMNDSTKQATIGTGRDRPFRESRIGPVKERRLTESQSRREGRDFVEESGRE